MENICIKFIDIFELFDYGIKQYNRDLKIFLSSKPNIEYSKKVIENIEYYIIKDTKAKKVKLYNIFRDKNGDEEYLQVGNINNKKVKLFKQPKKNKTNIEKRDQLLNSLYNKKNEYINIFNSIYKDNKPKEIEELIFYLEGKLNQIDKCLLLQDINKFQRRIIEIKKDIYLYYLENIIIDDKYDYNNINTYPELTDPDFNDKIYKKQEFYKNRILPENIKKKRSKEFILTATQKLIKNYISSNTPYNGLLIYHGVGVGKTCTALSIAENFKKDMIKMNKKILIMTPGETLNKTWRNEIFNIENEKKKTNKNINIQCTGDEYTKEYNLIKKKNKNREMDRIIYNIYDISTYQKQVNLIKRRSRKLNKNLYKTVDKREIAYIKKHYSNRIIIMDEIHSVKVSLQDKSNKLIPPYLDMIARYSNNTKIILLTATPVFNEFTEIIQLIDLLLLNDNRSPILIDDILKKSKTKFLFNKDKTDKLIYKTRGYVSFLRGSNPYKFPVRLYPESKQCIVPKWSNGNLVCYTHKMGKIQDKQFKIANKSTKGNYGQKGLDESLFAFNIHTLLGSYLNQRRKNKFYFNTDNNEVIKDNKSFLHYSRLNDYSCKYFNILDLIKNCEGTVFIYSDKVQIGIKLLAMILEENGFTRYNNKKSEYSNFLYSNTKDNYFKPKKYQYIYVDGETDNDTMSQWFSNYNLQQKNTENIKVILGSNKISQGVNLFRIREVHVLNPWFNLNKIEQVIGRATRQKSHLSLPNEYQNVTIYLHCAYDNKGNSTDENNYELSYNKKMNELELLSIIKQNAIDCNLNIYGNYFKTTESDIINSQKQKIKILRGKTCNIFDITQLSPTQNTNLKTYKCRQFLSKKPKCYTKIKNLELKEEEIDKSTFNETLAYYEISLLINKIKSIFSNNYAYKLEDILDEIKKIEKQQNILFQEEHIYIAIQTLLDNNLIVINKNNRVGNIIYKNKNYLFQPKDLYHKNTPIVYRNYPFMDLKDKINIPKQSLVKQEIKEEDFIKNNINDLLQNITNININNSIKDPKLNTLRRNLERKPSIKQFNYIHSSNQSLYVNEVNLFEHYEEILKNIKIKKSKNNIYFYKAFIGKYQLFKLKLNTNEKIIKYYQGLVKTSNIIIDFDRYLRYYILDRMYYKDLQKIIHYIIDKKYYKKEELNYKIGEHHIYDYLFQKTITGKNLYIFENEKKIYYRLYYLDKGQIFYKIFNYNISNNKSKVSEIITENELRKLEKYNITLEDIKLIKYCNYYGKLDIKDKIIKPTYRSTPDSVKLFKIIDLNTGIIDNKNISWKTGNSCILTSPWKLKGESNKSILNINILNVDLISFIFNIPVNNTSKIDNKPFIQIKKDSKNNLKNVTVYDNKKPIYNITKTRLNISCLEIECLFRYLRDVHSFAIQENNKIIPQYWFYNYIESIMQRHSTNNNFKLLLSTWLDRQFCNKKCETPCKIKEHSQDAVYNFCKKIKESKVKLNTPFKNYLRKVINPCVFKI